ncbi:hypothetical protein Tco_0005442 [Tanacetum coccineum]
MLNPPPIMFVLLVFISDKQALVVMRSVAKVYVGMSLEDVTDHAGDLDILGTELKLSITLSSSQPSSNTYLNSSSFESIFFLLFDHLSSTTNDVLSSSSPLLPCSFTPITSSYHIIEFVLGFVGGISVLTLSFPSVIENTIELTKGRCIIEFFGDSFPKKVVSEQDELPSRVGLNFKSRLDGSRMYSRHLEAKVEVTKLTTGRLNGSFCDGIDMVIKDLDLEPKDMVVEFYGPSRWKELSKESGSKILPCRDGSCWKDLFKPIATDPCREN